MFLIKKYGFFILSLYLLFLFIGIFNFAYHDSVLPSKFVSLYEGESLNLRGRVEDINLYNNESLRFILKSFPSVLIKTKGKIDIGEGDSVSILNVRLRRIDEKYPSYMRRYYKGKGVYFYAWIKPGDVRDVRASPFNFLYKIRGKIRTLFREAPILGALVLGKEMDISEDLKRDFIQAGIIHLFAVSGLHFGVIFIFLLFMSSFFLTKRTGAILSFLILSFYFFIVGIHPSVIRAYIMISLYVCAIILYRDYDLLSALSFSALVILILNPLEIKDPGFLLSFSSVFGIYLFDKIIDKESLIKPFYIMALTIWIWMLNLPIIINFFHRVPLFSILFTPFLGVFASFFIPFSFFISFASLISSHLSLFLISIIKPILAQYRTIVHLVAHFPFSSFIFPSLPFYKIVLWYLFLAILFFLVKERRYKKAVLSIFILFLVLFVFLFYPLPLGIHFISVGEGDAIFINYPHGVNILIDGGNLYNGKRVVNYLKKRGVNILDIVFVTHPDVDHWGGLRGVLSEFKVNRVFINGQPAKDRGYNEFLDSILARGIPLKSVRQGDKFYVGDNFSITVLSPLDKGFFEKDNNNSIVLGLKYGGFSAIFTGDLEAEGEHYLIDKKFLAHYDILKVAHHGSKSSTSPLFLDAISPSCAVISVGKNRYGHPSKKVVKLLKTYGVKVYRTDIDGDIKVLSYGRGWRVITSKGERMISYELSASY